MPSGPLTMSRWPPSKKPLSMQSKKMAHRSVRLSYCEKIDSLMRLIVGSMPTLRYGDFSRVAFGIAGEQDKRDFNRIMKRREEERAQAALNLPDTSESTVAPPAAIPSPYEHIKTPDETKGIAGGWVTVSVREVPPEEEVNLAQNGRAIEILLVRVFNPVGHLVRLSLWSDLPSCNRPISPGKPGLHVRS